jgi:hypothetical protein
MAKMRGIAFKRVLRRFGGLLALLWLLALPLFGQAQNQGIQAQQTASNPLHIRVTDGDLTSILGTFTFKASTVSVTANATNYIYLDLSQNPPQLMVNTTGFIGSNLYPIAIVTTNSNQIVSLVDSRPPFNATSFSGIFYQPNDTTTGTSLYGTAVINSSGNAVNAGTGTGGPFYIVTSNAGKSGSAGLGLNGVFQCVMDTTIASGAYGYYVVNSTSSGSECHPQSSAPSAGTYLIGFLEVGTTQSGSTAPVLTGTGSGELTTAGGSSFPVTSQVYIASGGTVTVQTGGAINTSGTGTITTAIASGTATLNTNAISSGACDTVVTVAASGVLTTDNILADFNADPTSTVGYEPGAMLTIVKYPTAGNVNFKVCNNTGSSITPGAAITLNWRVVR